MGVCVRLVSGIESSAFFIVGRFAVCVYAKDRFCVLSLSLGGTFDPSSVLSVFVVVFFSCGRAPGERVRDATHVFLGVAASDVCGLELSNLPRRSFAGVGVWCVAGDSCCCA